MDINEKFNLFYSRIEFTCPYNENGEGYYKYEPPISDYGFNKTTNLYEEIKNYITNYDGKLYVLFDPIKLKPFGLNIRKTNFERKKQLIKRYQKIKFYRMGDIRLISEDEIKKEYPFIDNMLIGKEFEMDKKFIIGYNNYKYMLPHELKNRDKNNDLSFLKNLIFVDVIKLEDYKKFIEFSMVYNLNDIFN